MAIHNQKGGQEMDRTTNTVELEYDLGNFEGFNFRDSGAIDRIVSAQEVVDWDHDGAGEAEFWPDGNHQGVWLVFKGQSSVSCMELMALDRLLADIGDDSEETFIKIHFCMDQLGIGLDELTADTVHDCNCMVFSGSNFLDVRKEAAFELFETFFPDEFAIWDKTLCDGLIFDEDRFLDSPGFSTLEIKFNGQVFLVVSFN